MYLSVCYVSVCVLCICLCAMYLSVCYVSVCVLCICLCAMYLSVCYVSVCVLCICLCAMYLSVCYVSLFVLCVSLCVMYLSVGVRVLSLQLLSTLNALFLHSSRCPVPLRPCWSTYFRFSCDSHINWNLIRYVSFTVIFFYYILHGSISCAYWDWARNNLVFRWINRTKTNLVILKLQCGNL
jgi:hypothetical protein